MRVLAFIAALLVAMPVGAGEKPPIILYLESLSPMPEEDRVLFDKAAKSMYREDCECLTYLLNGEIRKVILPLNDVDRRLLIRGLNKGIIIPFGPSGQGS